MKAKIFGFLLVIVVEVVAFLAAYLQQRLQKHMNRQNDYAGSVFA